MAQLDLQCTKILTYYAATWKSNILLHEWVRIKPRQTPQKSITKIFKDFNLFTIME